MNDVGISQNDGKFLVSIWTSKLTFKGQYAAVIAGLTMTVSNGIMSTANYDDLLALMHQYSITQKRKIHREESSDISNNSSIHKRFTC